MLQRDQYVPDGRMQLSRSPVLLVPIVSAVLSGYLLNWLFHIGWYLIILAAFLAAGIVSGAMVAVHFSGRTGVFEK